MFPWVLCWSLVHFELLCNFVLLLAYGVRKGVNFLLLKVGTQFFQRISVISVVFFFFC